MTSAIDPSVIGAGNIDKASVRLQLERARDEITDLQSDLATLPSTLLYGLRNLLINANPTVNQRAYVSGTATTVANQYTLDMWRVVVSGQSLSWTDSAGIRTVTFPAGGGEQIIEGASIFTGTHTLSWTGTATAAVNGTSVANGAQVSLTGGTNATLRFTNGTVSRPQLEPGSVVTPFERRHPQLELGMCQRYYELALAVFFGRNEVGVASFNETALPFKVQKRTTPAVTLFSSITTTGVTARTSINITTVGCGIQLQTVAGPTNFGDTALWAVDASLT
ncbi:hypothetical protein UFOVP810_52 [uncultured Caudovirales phage]|uniref:Uncharacterized protein n=1 Tax=uncultured Caudovirales phage TaxID=2100421 RepID=A0A6J5NW61_9CAUD|nr:hypothetical protein UFOVP810_52 [uncultured Caudovirales phage]